MADGVNADDESPAVATSPILNRGNESPTASLFSRFRANSISKLSFPFFENGFAPRRDSSIENNANHRWSSESSSDEDFPIDELEGASR
jgi:hypothetical protein